MKTYKLPKYDYPNKYDEHMIHVSKKVELPNLDENYPYINKKKGVRFFQWLFYRLVSPIAWVLVKIRLGYKVRGRKILKKNKELLKNGGISICNHVHMWDFLLVLLSLRPRRPKPIAWPINLMGPNRHLIRLVGGIPIPETYEAMKVFHRDIDEYIEKGKWIHVYPETAMWHYYDKIKPFKKGAFTYAVKHNKPIVPLVINYRRRSWFIRMFNKKPAMTVNILEPVVPNLSLGVGKAKEDLLVRCRIAMQDASGFEERIDQEQKYREPEKVNE